MAFSGNNVSIDNNTIKQNISGQIYAYDSTLSDQQRIINAQQSMAIIKLQANGTVTDYDYEGMFADTMSDSTGYNDTVSADVNTTAIYDSTNKNVA
jgi:hypothetical protein